MGEDAPELKNVDDGVLIPDALAEVGKKVEKLILERARNISLERGIEFVVAEEIVRGIVQQVSAIVSEMNVAVLEKIQAANPGATVDQVQTLLLYTLHQELVRHFGHSKNEETG